MRNPTNVRPFLFFRAIVQQTYLSAAVEDVEIKGEVLQKQNRYDICQIYLLYSLQSSPAQLKDYFFFP